MKAWISTLCAVAAFAAMIGLPSRIVQSSECCLEGGAVPVVTCFGRPKLDARQPKLTRQCNCCVPVVIEFARVTPIPATVLPDRTFGSSTCAIGVPQDAECAVVPVREVSSILHTTGPPCEDPPLYLLFGCFLI